MYCKFPHSVALNNGHYGRLWNLGICQFYGDLQKIFVPLNSYHPATILLFSIHDLDHKVSCKCVFLYVPVYLSTISTSTPINFFMSRKCLEYLSPLGLPSIWNSSGISLIPSSASESYSCTVGAVPTFHSLFQHHFLPELEHRPHHVLYPQILPNSSYLLHMQQQAFWLFLKGLFWLLYFQSTAKFIEVKVFAVIFTSSNHLTNNFFCIDLTTQLSAMMILE